MRKLNRFFLTSGISTLLIFLIPMASQAQDADAETSFTQKALVIGFLVVSIIILVFLGLLLKARVNELQSFLRKDISPDLNKKPNTNERQKLMSLDEDEVDDLLKERLRREQAKQTAAAAK